MPYQDREAQRAYRATHKTETAAYNRAYRAAHKEVQCVYASAYREGHKEETAAYNHAYKIAQKVKIAAYNRAYRAAHKAEIAAQERAYRVTNKAEIAAKKQVYADAHRAEIAARERAYYSAHPEIKRAHLAVRRARKAGAPRNDLSAAQWQEIKEAYGHRCVYCGRKMQRLTMDHIIPLAKGGSHTASNIVPACKSCNSRKHAGPPLVPVQPLLLTMAPAVKKRGRP